MKGTIVGYNAELNTITIELSTIKDGDWIPLNKTLKIIGCDEE